jgi:hypothetical protein
LAYRRGPLRASTPGNPGSKSCAAASRHDPSAATSRHLAIQARLSSLRSRIARPSTIANTKKAAKKIVSAARRQTPSRTTACDSSTTIAAIAARTKGSARSRDRSPDAVGLAIKPAKPSARANSHSL